MASCGTTFEAMRGVALIVPATRTLPTPPWGAVYLAAALNEHGIDVSIHDFNLRSWVGENSSYSDFDAPLVGVATQYSIHHAKYRDALSTLVLTHPRSTFVVGGPHVSCFPRAFSGAGAPDYVIRGAGGGALGSLAGSLGDLPNRSNRAPRLISGSEFPERCSVGATAKFLRVTKDVCLSDYDQVQAGYPAILHRGLPSAQVLYRRRCAFSCAHCVESVGSIGVEEFSNLREFLTAVFCRIGDQKVPHMYFLDPTFDISCSPYDVLAEELHRRNPELIWGAKCRLDVLSPPIIQRLRSLGCVFLEVGVEIDDEAFSGEVNKPAPTGSMLETFRRAADCEISIQANLILGFPSDTASTISKRIEYGRYLLHEFGVFPCCWVYSPLAKFARSVDETSDDFDWGGLSILPVDESGKVRTFFWNMERGIESDRFSHQVHCAWSLPAAEMELWFAGNRLLRAALSHLGLDLSSYLKRLFPQDRVGLFVGSRFFITEMAAPVDAGEVL